MSMKARPSTRSALAGSGTAPADRVGSQPRSRCRLRTGEQRSSDEVRCMSPVIQDSPKAIPGSIPHPLVRCPSIGRLKEEYRRFGIRPLRQHDKRSCDAVNPSTVARPAGALVQLIENAQSSPGSRAGRCPMRYPRRTRAPAAGGRLPGAPGPSCRRVTRFAQITRARSVTRCGTFSYHRRWGILH